MRNKQFRNWLPVVLAALSLSAVAAEHPRPSATKPARAELGTGVAFAPDGRLLAVTKEGAHLVLRSSADDGASWSAPVPVNAEPEPVAADGESRPSLVFTRDGVLLVGWAKLLDKPYTGEIRLARSSNGGRSFSAPLTVHHDRAEITHRFQSLYAAADGRVVVAWIDKRDQEAAKAAGQTYTGAAIYAAVSADGGANFAPEFKLADHACECCRTTIAGDADGTPVVFWRHVFDGNERDHALARLPASGGAEAPQRATADRWQIAACPHHGPSLTVDDAGRRHAVWFNQRDGEGHVFYARLPAGGDVPQGQRVVGGTLAANADIAVAGRRVGIVWKEFDGQRTLLRGEVSEDGGESFKPLELAASAGSSDQPRMLTKGGELFAFWRTDKEGMRLYPMTR